MKKCNECNEFKHRYEFHPRKRNKDGLNGICRVCHNVKRRQYYNDNKKILDEYSREYMRKKRGGLKRVCRKCAFFENNKCINKNVPFSGFDIKKLNNDFGCVYFLDIITKV